MKSPFTTFFCCLFCTCGLVVSCKNSEQKSTDLDQSRGSQKTGLLRDGKSDTGKHQVSARSVEVDPAVKRRYEKLRAMSADDMDLIRAIREGLAKDDILELRALAQWSGDMDAELVEQVLIDYFLNLEWGEAMSRFEFIKGNLAISAPLMGQMIEPYSRENPREALDWLVGNMSAPGIHNAAVIVGQSLGEEGSHAVIFDELFEDEKYGELRDNLLSGLVSNWLNLDFEAPFQHLSQKDPGPDLDQSVYGLVFHGSQINPEDTMPWAESIVDNGMKRSAVLQTAQLWEASDRDGYLEWKEKDAPEELLGELP